MTTALSTSAGPAVIDVRVDASEVPWTPQGRIAALRDGTETR
ncbi:hypothetical protein C5F59_035940 [Streptomyces sp. QL37]|nr:hypothetical protein [Streptomyces sp. QL37]